MHIMCNLVFFIKCKREKGHFPLTRSCNLKSFIATMIPHILHSVPIEKREGKMEEIISIAEVVYVCFFFFFDTMATLFTFIYKTYKINQRP